MREWRAMADSTNSSTPRMQQQMQQQLIAYEQQKEKLAMQLKEEEQHQLIIEDSLLAFSEDISTTPTSPLHRTLSPFIPRMSSSPMSPFQNYSSKSYFQQLMSKLRASRRRHHNIAKRGEDVSCEQVSVIN